MDEIKQKNANAKYVSQRNRRRFKNITKEKNQSKLSLKSQILSTKKMTEQVEEEEKKISHYPLTQEEI